MQGGGDERRAATEPVCGARGLTRPSSSKPFECSTKWPTTTKTAAATAQSTLPSIILIILIFYWPFIGQVHAFLFAKCIAAVILTCNVGRFSPISPGQQKSVKYCLLRFAPGLWRNPIYFKLSPQIYKLSKRLAIDSSFGSLRLLV